MIMKNQYPWWMNNSMTNFDYFFIYIYSVYTL